MHPGYVGAPRLGRVAEGLGRWVRSILRAAGCAEQGAGRGVAEAVGIPRNGRAPHIAEPDDLQKATQTLNKARISEAELQKAHGAGATQGNRKQSRRDQWVGGPHSAGPNYYLLTNPPKTKNQNTYITLIKKNIFRLFKGS